MALAPIEGRINPTAVWTGEELIVVGGYRDDVAKPGQPAQASTSDGRELAVTSFVDGAAYDPARDAWRPVAAAPGASVSDDAVWSGSRVLIRGGTTLIDDGPSDAAIFAYDPARNEWEVFPAPTGADDTLDVTMTWTGRELVVWGHPYRNYEEPALSAALDPTTGAWHTLPAGPLPAGMGPAAAWDGDEVVVVAGAPASIGPGSPPPKPVAALDPTTGRWRELPAAPTEVPGTQPTLIWTGDRLLVAGGTFGLPRNQGVLAFDPAEEHWSEAGRLDAASQFGEQRVWTGRQLVEIGGQDAAGGAISSVIAVDPITRTRSVLPNLPGPRSNAGAVWTGTELLVWGGQPDAEGIGTAMASGLRLEIAP
jgi:hypothetical protein